MPAVRLWAAMQLIDDAIAKDVIDTEVD